MKSIEITTSNNVVIQYELASVMQRFLAFFIDTIIVFIYYWIVMLFIKIFFINSWDWETAMILVYILAIPVTLFYHLTNEVFFGGQSIGKRLMKIKVVNLSGEPPSINNCFLRWTYRLIDVGFSLGSLAAIFISASEKSQRLGDVAANTVVISLNPSQTYSLKDILTIASKGSHEPTYSQVTMLTDDDMLLIKNAVDRYKMYPNEEHKKFILDLTANVMKRLNISESPKNKLDFLHTLLKDYIVLTR